MKWVIPNSAQMPAFCGRSRQNRTFDGTIPMQHFPGTHMDEMKRIVGKYQPATGMETEEGWRSIGNADPNFFLDNDRVPERVPEAYRMRGQLPGVRKASW